ncbi:hypothetical protein VMCG_10080 [Cytospora schulzeri]|uniref:Uncharacterized protein n=1 Tax=Cytospora schulzeri TaxID=448051 RepID=A0A423VCN4_9PEZI|nr:hypothetical protein VMCG_10080 [Valsa malicola]
MTERRPTDEVVLMSEELGDPAGGTPSAPDQGDSLIFSRRWVYAKLVLRSTVMFASFITTIVSFVWIEAYLSLYPYTAEGVEDDYYPFPVHPVLSLSWEITEITLIIKRHDRDNGLCSGAHVVVEPILCLSGMGVAAFWIHITNKIAVMTYDLAYDSWHEEEGWTAYDINSWASLGYFWGAMVLFTSACQLVLFALCSIEAHNETRKQLIRKRKEHKRHVSEALRLIEQRGQNPEDLLRSLEARTHESNDHRRFKPYSTIELATFHHNPVEMVADRLPPEMEGSRAVVGEGAPASKPDDMAVSPLSPSENTIGEMFPFISVRTTQV